MPRRDEFNLPEKDSELNLPRELPPPRESYAPRAGETVPPAERYAPWGAEHPLPGAGDGIAGRSRRRKSWLWLLTAAVVVTAAGAAEQDYEKPLPPPSSYATPCDPLPASTPEPVPPSPVADGDILLGTWSNGEILVHFDEDGGWWKKEDIFALMDWEEENGDITFTAESAANRVVESESGPYISCGTLHCRDTVRLDRSREPYCITMDSPFPTESRDYYPVGDGLQSCPALEALYGKSAEEILSMKSWQVAPQEELQSRIDSALADKNPYNRQLIWVSGLRVEGESAVLTISDVYGGSQEFTLNWRMAESTPNLLLLDVGETGMDYRLTDPRGGAYSQTYQCYSQTIPCRLGYCEQGALLYVYNPYWSWLYQYDCCVLCMGE